MRAILGAVGVVINGGCEGRIYQEMRTVPESGELFSTRGPCGV